LRHFLSQERAREAEAKTSAAQASPTSAVSADQLALLQAALDDEKAKRLAAGQDAKTVRQQVAQLKDEVVVSYGKVTQIGSTLGSVFSEALALAGLEKKGELTNPENEIRFAKFLEQASSISGLSREIIGFEDNPEEGSHFIASAYGAAFGLNEAEQEKIAGFFAQKLKEAGELKYTLSNLPERGPAEFEPWLEKRWGWFGASRGDLRQLIPASFDEHVEKGGYEFKNMKLKGMPLMFSPGGDPR